MHCSNHVVDCRSEDDASRGQSLFTHGSVRREYANVVWGGEEDISPSSAGDHSHIERSSGLVALVE